MTEKSLTDQVIQSLKTGTFSVRLGTQISNQLKETRSLDEVFNFFNSFKLQIKLTDWFKNEAICKEWLSKNQELWGSNTTKYYDFIIIIDPAPSISSQEIPGFIVYESTGSDGTLWHNEKIPWYRRPYPCRIPAMVFPINQNFSEYVAELKQISQNQFSQCADHIYTGLVVYYLKAPEKIDFFELPLNFPRWCKETHLFRAAILNYIFHQMPFNWLISVALADPVWAATLKMLKERLSFLNLKNQKGGL